jgi:hypothetical protein
VYSPGPAAQPTARRTAPASSGSHATVGSSICCTQRSAYPGAVPRRACWPRYSTATASRIARAPAVVTTPASSSSGPSSWLRRMPSAPLPHPSPGPSPAASVASARVGSRDRHREVEQGQQRPAWHTEREPPAPLRRGRPVVRRVLPREPGGDVRVRAPGDRLAEPLTLHRPVHQGEVVGHRQRLAYPHRHGRGARAQNSQRARPTRDPIEEAVNLVQ